jgi:hypothetical protein
LFVLTACGGPDRGSYVAANAALLATMPPFPGAREIGRESMSYSLDGDGGFLDKPEGYGTRVTYQLTGGVTTDDVTGHYIAVAGPEWSHRFEFTLMLCRGESLVSVDTSGVSANQTYDVYVDYSYAQEGIRTAGCD